MSLPKLSLAKIRTTIAILAVTTGNPFTWQVAAGSVTALRIPEMT